MKKLSIFLFFLIPGFLISQFDATVIFPELEGQDLLENVVDSYKPSVVLAYGPARDTMFSNIYNINDSLSGVYTGHTLYVDPALDPTVAVFLNGIDNGINTEHTYPRSKGAENGNARSDMNHLFATRVRVNSERGNLPFGDIDDQNTLQWFINTSTQPSIPSNNIDGYSEWDGQVFEPREAHKGNVARAMFYFYTMYKAEADAADPDFFEPQIETFCRWHDEDPVDSLEWIRAQKISIHQDGKVNPFVLDCTLPGRTYCEAVSAACRSVSSTNIALNTSLKIYPNPFSDFLNIELDFEGKNDIGLKIYDVLGNLIYTQKSIAASSNYKTELSKKDLNLFDNQLLFVQISIEGNKGEIERINRLVVLEGE